MKKVILLPVILILITGCIKVEDAEDTSSPASPSVELRSKVIVSGEKNDFTLTWQKNIKGYRQLEITQDPATPHPIASSNAEVTITLTCEFQGNVTENGIASKKYYCNLENAGVIGSFPLIFPVEMPMEVIERSGTSAGDDYEVLSNFYIHNTLETSDSNCTVTTKG